MDRNNFGLLNDSSLSECDFDNCSFETVIFKPKASYQLVSPQIDSKANFETYHVINKQEFSWNLEKINPEDYNYGEMIRSEVFPKINEIDSFDWSLKLLFKTNKVTNLSESFCCIDLDSKIRNDVKISIVSHIDKKSMKDLHQIIKADYKIMNDNRKVMHSIQKQNLLFNADNEEVEIGFVESFKFLNFDHIIICFELILFYDDMLIKKKVIEWKINEIKKLINVNNHTDEFYLETPKFNFNGSKKQLDSEKYKWVLQLFPAGKDENYRDSISIFLKQVSGPSVLASAKFTISDKRYMKKKDLPETKFVPGQRWGISQLISSKEFSQIFKGSFKIHCQISIFESKTKVYDTIITNCHEKKSALKLFDKLHFDRKWGINLDIGLSSLKSNYLVRLNKTVLFVLSKKFVDTVKRKSPHSNIEIIDMNYSGQCIADFVEFMYKFKLNQSISFKELTELYSLAIDYSIESLVTDCENLIIKNYITFKDLSFLLDSKNFFLTKRLKDAVFGFLTNNFKQVSENRVWQELLFKNELLTHEYLQRFMNR